MKTKPYVLIASLILNSGGALATVRYVDANSTNAMPPYTNWTSAARVIQDAVDAALAGDEIVVTNGLYATGGRPVGTNLLVNRVAVDKPLALRSVNGPESTIIQGHQEPPTTNAIRCAYLANGAVLSGFTLTNGSAWPGDWPSYQGGGGIFCASPTCVVTNCIIVGNLAWFGGGVEGGTVYNCTISNNVNYGMFNSGGGAINSVLYNCLLSGNSSETVGGASDCTLNNCTIVGNSSGYGPCVVASTLNNCILYGNTPMNWDSPDWSIFHYCCTTPMPTNGIGNITLDPQLASAGHLSANSPCRGAGNPAYTTGTDIDGEPWATPPSIGCDEYRPGSVTGPLNVGFLASFTNVAVGFPVRLTVLIEGRTSASAWDFGDGVIVSNRLYASHAWAAPGNYPVVLRAYNESHPSGVSATVMIHVLLQPVHYVAADSANPVPPYTSWATSATNIQDAVDAANLPGALVLVTNGIYAGGGRAEYDAISRVAVDKQLELRSVNGPEFTIIRGRHGTTNFSDAIRCVRLVNGARLSGFTLTNGGAQYSGGGVSCASEAATVSNCVIIGNSAASIGGGVFRGTLNNCTLTGNTANTGGGAYEGTLNNCTLTGNFASQDAGGAGYYSTLNNCTVVGNSALNGGGGVYYSTLNNCIVYFNTAAHGANHVQREYGPLNFCCTTPMPTNGIGNITNAPLFADYAGGNLRLQSNSPCINVGNNAYVTNSTDLDGNLRIAGGTVDIGAYEFQGRPGWQPGITSQPRSVAALAGSNATFRVIGTGAAPLVYQWQLDGRNLLSATNATLTVSNVSLTDLGSYSVSVRNIWGETNSQRAWLKLARWPELVVFDASISFASASNGKSWVEWFAERACLSAPGQVKNYATGGATCSDVRSQITTYLSAYTPGANTLLAPWWAGMTTDLVWRYRPVAEVVSNYAANITQLAEAGGKVFILPNLEPLYLNPGLDSAYARSLDYQDINERMDREIQRIQADYGLTIYRFDFWGLGTNLYADPGAYGFTNVTGAARNYPSGDADKFLWWDGIHPTTALHRVISEATYQCLTPPLVLAAPARTVDGSWALHWQGGAGPFRLQHGEDMPGDLWHSGELTFSTNQTVIASPTRQFFRLLQLGQ